MTFKITKPGIYTDISAEDYFADPTPTPSLTQSLAKILIAQSPLHAWYAHPRLNPDYRHDDDRKFDVGNVAHKLMIGRGKNIAVLDFDDWRTKEAKAARAAAATDGKLAVLSKHFGKAEKMVKAAREQLDLRGLKNMFRQGNGEVVIAWERNGLWFRQMIDWLSPGHNVFTDYKTTGESAAPQALPRKMVNDGWPIQAAMADNGLNALERENAGRRRYFFVVQEDEPPYAITVAEMSEAAMTMGGKQLEYAFSTWADCLTHNRFPGYPLETCVPSYPGWHEQQWLEREVAEHDARNPHSQIAADHMAAG